MTEKLYSISEAADVLSYSQAYIRNMIGNGDIKAVKVSNWWVRIPETEVNRLLDRQKKIEHIMPKKPLE